MIVLATLNAKYIHASLGLRYLLANMGPLRAQTVLCEFTISQRPEVIVQELLLTLDAETLAYTPPLGQKASGVQIIAFGVYIWNVLQTTAVLRLLKAARPQLKIVLGGPEVSHETDEQDIVQWADFVITGWGEVSFAKLCQAILNGQLSGVQPLGKIITGEQAPLDQLALPYDEYSAADLAHRLLYVEASRGCPYKCHFCLSALDKTAWAFPLEAFLVQLDALYRRGARKFKFVDRTFNLKIEASVRILQFFLQRLTASAGALFVHFEVIPDHLPARLKDMIAQFPPGVLQFEVGVQTFNVAVQQRIARKQDNEKTEANLRWLLAESHAHLHVDLIFALPGESMQSFADGFDRLYALQPHEIQLGILKRLRGTPIALHSVEFGMVYDTEPPYTIQQTGAVDRDTLLRFTRFARYWELLANSGRFNATIKHLLRIPASDPAAKSQGSEEFSPFYAFLALSDWLWQRAGKTHALTPEYLVDALFEYLVSLRDEAEGDEKMASAVKAILLADYLASGARGKPQALQDLLPGRRSPLNQKHPPPRQLMQRQDRHLSNKNFADQTKDE